MQSTTWMHLPADVWAYTFKTYLEFSDLLQIRLTCKAWNGFFLKDTCGAYFVPENQRVPGEPWLKTLCKKITIIALDCSGSMKRGSENWRYEAAALQAKEIADQSLYSCKADMLWFMPFAGDVKLYPFQYLKKIDSDHGVGDVNNWSVFFTCLNRKINAITNKEIHVHILGDFEDCPYVTLGSQAYKVSVQFHLHLIGNSSIGNEAVRTIELASQRGESDLKKQKQSEKIRPTFTVTRLSQNPVLTLSKVPTLVIENN